MKLLTCSSCDGFVPRSATECPHCSAALSGSSATSRLGVLATALGGGAIAVTLMACYGGPPRCADGTKDCFKVAPTAEPSAAPVVNRGDGGAP